MLDAFLQKGCKMMETFVTIKSIWAFWSYYWFVNALGGVDCSNCPANGINISLFLKYYIKNSSCQSNLDYTLATLCLPQQIKADSLKFKTEKASIQKNFKERFSHCNLGLLSQTLKSIKLISQRRQQNRRRRLSVKVGWSESSFLFSTFWNVLSCE